MQPYPSDENQGFPPAVPAKGRSRRSLALIVGGVVLVVALCVGGMFLFAGNSPTETVNDYFTATKDGNLKDTQALVCRKAQNASRAGFAKSHAQFTEHKFEWKVTRESKAKKLAKVEVELTRDGKKETITMTLRDESGWKVCS